MIIVKQETDDTGSDHCLACGVMTNRSITIGRGQNTWTWTLCIQCMFSMAEMIETAAKL